MFVTAYNFSNLPSELIQEKVSDEVLVEPSESFTVRELIYRLAMGSLFLPVFDPVIIPIMTKILMMYYLQRTRISIWLITLH